jgi:hypothetical protein
MKLHPEEKAKLVQFIQIKWKLDDCPVCRKTETYDVSEQVYQIVEYPEMGRLSGEVVAPIVPVTCRNCGNTILVNALVAGVDLKRKPA